MPRQEFVDPVDGVIGDAGNFRCTLDTYQVLRSVQVLLQRQSFARQDEQTLYLKSIALKQ